MENNPVNYRRISNDDAFIESLFGHYFKPLAVFAGHYIPDPNASEDIIQDVFLSLIESLYQGVNLTRRKGVSLIR